MWQLIADLATTLHSSQNYCQLLSQVPEKRKEWIKRMWKISYVSLNQSKASSHTRVLTHISNTSQCRASLVCACMQMYAHTHTHIIKQLIKPSALSQLRVFIEWHLKGSVTQFIKLDQTRSDLSAGRGVRGCDPLFWGLGWMWGWSRMGPANLI